MAAMASVAAERGYVDTRVDDVIAAAGVSRRTFYQHFNDRQECFLAAYDAIRGDAFSVFSPRDEDPPAQRLELALQRGLEHFAAWPQHARVFLNEINSLGPQGSQLHEHTMSELAALLVGCGTWTEPGWNELERPERAQAIVGAMHRVISSRLAHGRHEALPALAPGLRAIAGDCPS